MKRFLTILAVIVLAAACTPKDNPGVDGRLVIRVTLPDYVTTPVTLGFYDAGNGYSQAVSAQNLQGHVLSASFEYSLTAHAEGDEIPVYVVDQDNEVYSADLLLGADKASLSGSLAQFPYVSGEGTKNKPYLIAGPKQLKYMMDFYKKASQPASKTTFKYWFCLLEDVDASGFDWVPLNNGGSFYKAIDFNGLGHTISGLKSVNQTYASFAGVLYGDVRNVTFDRATISLGSGKKGVVAGFLGTDGLPGSCENVHVTNSTVSGGSYSGGFAGHIRTTGTIDNCSVEGTTVSSTNSHVGGFAGALDLGSGDKYEVPARLTGCFVKDVTVNEGLTSDSDAVYAGGFIGASVQSGTYRNCTVKATVNGGTAFLGGVGAFVGGTSYAGSNFHDCHVLPGTFVEAGSTTRVGGFVGYSQTADIYNLCSVSAAVTGNADVGGFAGLANGSASFTDCSVRGSVNAVLRAGGFIGKGDNVSCYACNVTDVALSTTNSVAGGFIGDAASVGLRFCCAVMTYSGNDNFTGSFVGDTTSDKASVTYCIGWHPSLPFAASTVTGVDFAHNYSGNSGTVSSQAAAAGWPAANWDFSAAFPTRKEGSKTVNAIFVGDSITWQWGRREGEYSKTNYPLKIDFNPAYMEDKGANVLVRFHPGFFSANGYIDKGISGQNTTQMKARFKKDVLDMNPVAVVIMGGTNDIAQGVSSDTIFGNISSMAASAKDAGIKVVICSITPNNRKYGVGYKATFIEPLNVRFKELCDATEGYTYCDYWSSLVARTIDEVAKDKDGNPVETDVMHGLKGCYMLYDDLHPGPDGYDVMEPIIKGILNSI